ncbi:MAG: hypothetical protein WC389_10935 [Lutibacter sp.]|jgi:hypothetical protein
MKPINPCAGCGREHNCNIVCSRFLQYQLDGVDEDEQPILTPKEKKMVKFNGYFNEFEKVR